MMEKYFKLKQYFLAKYHSDCSNTLSFYSSIYLSSSVTKKGYSNTKSYCSNANIFHSDTKKSYSYAQTFHSYGQSGDFFEHTNKKVE